STITVCAGGRTRPSGSCSITTGGFRRPTRCSGTSTSPASARCGRGVRRCRSRRSSAGLPAPPAARAAHRGDPERRPRAGGGERGAARRGPCRPVRGGGRVLRAAGGGRPAAVPVALGLVRARRRAWPPRGRRPPAARRIGSGGVPPEDVGVGFTSGGYALRCRAGGDPAQRCRVGGGKARPKRFLVLSRRRPP